MERCTGGVDALDLNENFTYMMDDNRKLMIERFAHPYSIQTLYKPQATDKKAN